MSQQPEAQNLQGEFIANDLAEFSFSEKSHAASLEDHYSHASLPQHILRVKDLPAAERPRDRLILSGAKSLSTGELLSILLGTGQGAGKLSALGLGQYILQKLGEGHCEPLDRLREVSAEELTQIPGVGLAKAATILAGIELGKRVFLPRPPNRTVIDDPATAASVLFNDLMWESQERIAVLLLNVKNQLLGNRIVSIGSATETIAQPRDIFREAIRQGATRVIVAHNHPSGALEPSPEDIVLTRHLLQAGGILNIPVLDHLIVGNGNYLSLRETTNLWQESPQADGT